MKQSYRNLLLILLACLALAGCAPTLQIGLEDPREKAGVQATVDALMAERAELATQVSGLSTAVAAAQVVAAAPATPTAAAKPSSSPVASPASPTPGPAATAPPATSMPTRTATAAASSTPAQTAVPRTEVNADAANLRSGPGLAYPVVGQAKRGDSLVVAGRNAGGDWLQVSTGGRTAWIAASLVSTNVSGSGLTVVQVVAPPPASPTPTAEPAPTAQRCDSVPIRGFGKVWAEQKDVAGRLGCARGWPGVEVATESAVQTFEHGLMIWLSSDGEMAGDPVYVLFEGGDYQRFPNLGPADPAVVGATQVGFHEAGPHFGKVYWEGTGVQVRERLGRAIGPQTDTPGAFQQFDNGRMIWLGSTDRIYVVYDYWRPVTAGQTATRVWSWISFPDTFDE